MGSKFLQVCCKRQTVIDDGTVNSGPSDVIPTCLAKAQIVERPETDLVDGIGRM